MKQIVGIFLVVAVTAGVVLLVSGRLGDPRLPSETETPFAFPKGGATLKIVQRHDADVPGTGGRVRVHIGDVTHGQVEVSLSRKDGGVLLSPVSMSEHDEQVFSFAGHRYRVEMAELKNLLIGNDYAVLRFSSGPSERARIEALLKAIETSGLKFVRNGKEYDGAAAARHLRRKWNAAGSRIETAEQFIEHIASGSSTSGKPYEMVLADGTRVKTRDWLTERLSEQS